MTVKFAVFSRDTKGIGDGNGGGGALFGIYDKHELAAARDRRDNLELTSPSCDYFVARVMTPEEIAGHLAGDDNAED